MAEDNSKSLLGTDTRWTLYLKNYAVLGGFTALVILATLISACFGWWGLSFQVGIFYFVQGMCWLIQIIIFFKNRQMYNNLKNGITS